MNKKILYLALPLLLASHSSSQPMVRKLLGSTKAAGQSVIAKLATALQRRDHSRWPYVLPHTHSITYDNGKISFGLPESGDFCCFLDDNIEKFICINRGDIQQSDSCETGRSIKRRIDEITKKCEDFVTETK